MTFHSFNKFVHTRGISGRELTRRTGISFNRMRYFLNYPGSLRLWEIEILADTLNTSPEDIIKFLKIRSNAANLRKVVKRASLEHV